MFFIISTFGIVCCPLSTWQSENRLTEGSLSMSKKKVTLIVRRAILTPVRASHYLGEIPGVYRMEKVSQT